MKYADVQKIQVAPQIVVYRNIFKFNQEMIDLLDKDNADSILDPWRDWYDQGERRGILFNKFNDISESDTNVAKKEKEYLKEIYDITDFINNDYFNEFKNNGTWPEFILDWDKLKSIEDEIYIDYFKYEHEKEKRFNRPAEKLLMDYHIDELPIPNEIKFRRHVATINFYLNNTYDGGEICVYDDVSKKSYKYKPMPGDAVIMPSTEPFYHGVKQYFNANRYFARTFLDYVSDKNISWESKYIVEPDAVMTESEYVDNDLQIIKISTNEITVENGS
jgi:hypothetical protein